MEDFITHAKDRTKRGMYGWLFPKLDPLKSKIHELEALGEAMLESAAAVDDPEFDSRTPAGYTFLGQFVDHDVTFDTTPLPERSEDVLATTNFRTPALDLDCLYGNGPLVHPFLYQRDLKSFAIGQNQKVKNFPKVDHDLPRSLDGLALVADPRNDTNLIVAQLHLAMLKFHNKVVRHNPDWTFSQARAHVTHHYQSMVLNDLLPRIVDKSVLDEVVLDGPEFYRVRRADEFPFIPVEFSAAVYRFGHSMIRERYSFGGAFTMPVSLSSLFRFTGPSGTVGPNLPVPSSWVIDWRRFFFDERAAAAEARLESAITRNYARKITAMISPGLKNLPFLSDVHSDQKKNLAIRNLIRGNAFGLPSGQEVAKAMKLEAFALSPDEICSGPDGTIVSQYGYDKATPLWYYTLKEAEVLAKGERLGPVGSRIVAEVFVGLLQRPGSLLHKDTGIFKPEFGRIENKAEQPKCTMSELLEWTGELRPEPGVVMA
jgi:hypothetical protein